jgi:uracil-DNA glycosylase
VEIRTCNGYLAGEIAGSPDVAIMLALGTIAHRAVLMASGLKQSAYAFAHGARHDLPDGRVLFDSYHCSRYNTQTRRLTEQSFHDVFAAIRNDLDGR